ncbi:MAG: hypothetical protein GYA34_03990 [Chloroflexi bacterium]|nr:hypothetical protein [Chloroflexota bacterium]
MTIISDNLLNDTLKLLQLAKETAQLRGQTEQANHLTPVADNLQSLVSSATQTQHTQSALAPQKAEPSSEILAQSDFKTLLSLVQTNNPQPANPASQIFSASSTDRNHIITAMVQGGMSILDISRQMGMTRDEVQMFISLTNPKQNTAIGKEE